MKTLGSLLLGILVVFGGCTMPSASAASASTSCSTSASSGSCVFPQDKTDFPGINPGTGRPDSNAIEIDQDEWNGGCSGTQTINANSPEDFSVTANYPANGGAICSYPNVWPHDAQGAVNSYAETVATFHESFPHNSGTQAHAMFDLWFNNWAYEVMVQYDFSNDAPCEGSWPLVKENVQFDAQAWHLCTGNNGQTMDWKLGPSDGAQEQSESSGTVHIKAMVKYLEQTGMLPKGLTWTAISMGWEIASTGGQPETFTGSGFTVDMVPKAA